MLLERVLVSGFLFEFVVLGVILLILVENFGVVRQVLLIRCPGFALLASCVQRVVVIEISRANVVMVDSVLDVFKVFVSDWHTDLTKLVDNLVLWVLSNVLHVGIEAFLHLAERLLSLF